MANNQNPPTPELFTIQAGDWPIDPYVVDGVELAARLNRAIPSEFDALKTGKANLNANNTYGSSSVEHYFSANGVRFIGNFYSGTLANRFIFQSYPTANQPTYVTATPGGTARAAGFVAHDVSDPTNSNYTRMLCSSAVSYFDAGGEGTAAGTFPVINFRQGTRVCAVFDGNGMFHVVNTHPTQGYTTMQIRSADSSVRRMLLVGTDNSLGLYDSTLQTRTQNFLNNGEIQARGNVIAQSVSTSPLGGQASLYHESNNNTGATVSLSWLHESLYNVKVGVGWVQNVGNTLAPAGDNAVNLGWGLARWSVVYAANGTINTSDAREKTPLRNFNAAELAAAKELADMVGVYKWLKDINEKGREEALWQIGVTAQGIDELFRKHGLNAFEYGIITREVFPEAPPCYGPDPETGEEVCLFEGRPYTEVWGANYAQINQFLIRGMHERMKDVERRLALLEGL